MEQTCIKTKETKSSFEYLRHKPRTAKLGEWVIIHAEKLGINDPLTHLYQYLCDGTAAETGIKQDIETAIAERLPKTPFANFVDYYFTGQDFVSVKDHVSMNNMVKNNLNTLKNLASLNQDTQLDIEYKRAEIESQEVEKLIKWYNQAPIGSHLIFESLPIGEQQFAISRIYQKRPDNRLEGCFVSLYNADLDQFNNLRRYFGVTKESADSLEILANEYGFFDQQLLKNSNFNHFCDYYAEVYDQLLEKKYNQMSGSFNFGIETDQKTVRQNGIEKVRRQPKLLAIYLDMIKLLASSEGYATPQLISLNNRLNTDCILNSGQKLTTELAREIIDKTMLAITSVIDRADHKLLEELNSTTVDSNAYIDTAAYYGEIARSEHQTYDSGGCPEYSAPTNVNNAVGGQEYSAIAQAFHINQKLPNNFGKPKIGLCQTSNCPSRGKSWLFPDKTLVGGCDFCLRCHKILSKGNNPKNIYNLEDRQQRSKIQARKTVKPKGNQKN